MLTGITFKNFKCFGEQTYLEINPITLIYGKNSSGKSSVLQFIKLLYVSINNHKDFLSDILTFRDTEKKFDLNSFENCIYLHNNELDLEIIFHIKHKDTKTNEVVIYDYNISIGYIELTSNEEKSKIKKLVLKNTKVDEQRFLEKDTVVNNKNTIFSSSYINDISHKTKSIDINYNYVEEIRNFLLQPKFLSPVLFNGVKVNLSNIETEILFTIFEESKIKLSKNPLDYLKRFDLKKFLPKITDEILVESIKNINRNFNKHPSIRKGFKAIKFNKSLEYKEMKETDAIIWDINLNETKLERFKNISGDINIETNLEYILSDLKRLKDLNNEKNLKRRSLQSYYFDSLKGYNKGNLSNLNEVDELINFLIRLKKTPSNPEYQFEEIHNFLRHIIKKDKWNTNGFFLEKSFGINAPSTYRDDFNILQFFDSEADIVADQNEIFDFSIFSRIEQYIKTAFKNIHYLPPHSNTFERYYFVSDKSEKNMTAFKLYEDSNLRYSINEFFKVNEIPYKIEVKEFKLKEDNVELFEIRVRDLESDASIHILDTGYGISQFISFIAILFSNKGELILKQEVESNLHPTWQIKVANALLEQLRTSVNIGKDLQTETFENFIKTTSLNKVEKMEAILNKTNYYNLKPIFKCILETHSEHIVLKLKQLVKQGKIDPENLGIYYVYKDKEAKTSILERIRVNEKGRFIDKWKDDFFPERIDLL